MFFKKISKCVLKKNIKTSLTDPRLANGTPWRKMSRQNIKTSLTTSGEWDTMAKNVSPKYQNLFDWARLVGRTLWRKISRHGVPITTFDKYCYHCVKVIQYLSLLNASLLNTCCKKKSAIWINCLGRFFKFYSYTDSLE